ncbi:MAG TPA: lipid-binding SYLF domain-containing protein [Pyrinomonadaceae bacterium]|nr:lipid-binding SYLF domain-containing protein [Pyrinomonadaceae bacterium]
MTKRFTVSVFVFTLLLTFSSAVLAQKKTGKDLQDAVKRVNDASEVMVEIMRIKDKSIPRDLLDKAKAVVVFPGAIKGAFIVGGQGGKGVAVRRLGRGWSAPAFLNMAGGSVGLQIGGSKTDYVMLIMNDKGMKGLLEDKFELGGEGSVAAGPIGRTAAASTNATLDAEILTYSRSKGLFAGVSLKGVSINSDGDLNQAIYQKRSKEIIGNPALSASAAPATLRKFGETVAMYAH